MLVEDDKSLREIYGVRLLAEGYDIVSAGDGEEALAMAIKDRPQLIISDVMMPKISGFDMLDILRSTTETKGIKVIMMTALSSEEQRQRGEQLGADKYLVKSQVGIEDVVKAVHDVLGDKPGAAAATPERPVTSPSTPAPAPAPAPAAATPPPATLNTIPPPAAPAPASSIPEPTAPFTGQRPANLGDRVIQPLKDNPRVSNENLGELIDKELATTVPAPAPTVAIPDTPVAPAQAPAAPAAAVSMPTPVAPAPAPESPDDLASVVPAAMPPAPAPAAATPVPATTIPEPTPTAPSAPAAPEVANRDNLPIAPPPERPVDPPAPSV